MKTIEYYMSLPYRIEIIPDKEEGGFTAWYPDLPGCVTCSDTMDGILANALDAKKEWFMAALEEGVLITEPAEEAEDASDYSGQFRIRMPKTLHKRLATDAKREGISMNQYCNYLLTLNESLHNAQRTLS